MKTYSTNSTGKIINFLSENGYDLITIEEGTLGYGHIIALAPDDKHYNVEIQEVYLNEWNSGHTIRNFDKISKRIEKLLETA